MGSLGRDLFAALFMGLVVPGVLLNLASVRLTEAEPPSDVPPETTALATLPRESAEISLRRGEAVTPLGLEEYLVGVVLAEMPASFAPEALKAQAVAARTYTGKTMVTGGKHGDGSLCDDPGCCQAYIPPEDYLARGGTEAGVQKVRAAVEDTWGQVLTYEGELIEATYFSSSGGSTESALAVWGTDYPYLQAVDSPGETAAAHHTDTVEFSPEEFQQKLGQTLSGSPEGWFREVAYTDGGGVDTMVIGAECYTGTQLRSLLGLRSTAFSIRVGDTITVTTHGYGHRVGLSQYGADAMAVTGSDHAAILAHYYPGTELTQLGETE